MYKCTRCGCAPFCNKFWFLNVFFYSGARPFEGCNSQSISSSQVGQVSFYGLSSFYPHSFTRWIHDVKHAQLLPNNHGPAEGYVVFVTLICSAADGWLHNLPPAVGAVRVRLTGQTKIDHHRLESWIKDQIGPLKWDFKMMHIVLSCNLETIKSKYKIATTQNGLNPSSLRAVSSVINKSTNFIFIIQLF